jgi:hypothetical protein
MKIVEIVAAAKAKNPKVFAGVPDARASRIVLLALAEIAKQIDGTVEGPVPVPGFGRFVVRRVQPQANSPATTGAPGAAAGVVRRVAFQRAKAIPRPLAGAAAAKK